MRVIKRISFVLMIFIPIIIPTLVFGDVTLTNEEFDLILTQFEKDKKIISECQSRWDKIRTSVPEVEYQVENRLIIQKITIPVENENPLEFKTTFALKEVGKEKKFIPFRLKLVGGVETLNDADVKIGVEFFSLEPLRYEHIKDLSLNFLLGIQSSAISVSYRLPHPFSNTTIHVYTGIRYDTELSHIVGLGVGLDF